MTPDPVLRFSGFEILPAERVLRVAGRNVALGGRAFDLLLALAERRGQLVSKQELLDLVWPGVVVEEHNIAAQLSTLRKLLGPDAIVTVAGRGYRFVAAPAASTPAPAPEGDAAPVAPARPLADRHNLPEPRTRFIGREAAVADLARLLPQSRLITLTGIGGSGKTRLALEFARRQLATFSGDVRFVDLAPLQSDERVASVCAAVLGLGEEKSAGLVERLAAHLAGRTVLLVLDNCEHVRQGAAALADAVLARAGASRIVATSREPLGVPGEQQYRVRGMALPATSQRTDVELADAVRLFAERARLASPEFEIDDDNAAAVAEICRRLDGIALAIELAAARVALLPVTDIARRLGENLRLLDVVASGDLRQRTLTATIEWSFDQLAPAAQRLLCHIAVFAGGWTLEAATAVAGCTDDYETLALLTALHEHSLIAVERAAPGGQPRYRMLETVRQFAHQRLQQSGQADAAHARHAAFFLALAEAVAPQLRGPQQPQAMKGLRAEQENLVAAIVWSAAETSPADPQLALRLVAATSRYWLFNAIALGRELSQAALRHAGDRADPATLFKTLFGLSSFHMHSGDAPAAFASGRAALEIAQREQNVAWQTAALTALGSACDIAGDTDSALRYQTQALELAESNDDFLYISMSSNNIGEIERRNGAWDKAERAYLRSLEAQRKVGDPLSMLIILHNMVRQMVTARRHDAARSFAREAATLLRGIDEVVLKFELLKVTACLAASLGEHARAARWWGASHSRFVDAGFSDPDVDAQLAARLLGQARRALGDAAYETLDSAGKSLAIEDAMAEVREWLARDA